MFSELRQDRDEHPELQVFGPQCPVSICGFLIRFSASLVGRTLFEMICFSAGCEVRTLAASLPE